MRRKENVIQFKRDNPFISNNILVDIFSSSDSTLVVEYDDDPDLCSEENYLLAIISPYYYFLYVNRNLGFNIIIFKKPT